MGYWLVGEAPAREHVDNPEIGLTPDGTGMPNLANRLLDLTGWTIGQFVAIFEVRTTVWKRAWPMWLDEGRKRAAAIGEAAKGSEGVVLVGHMAAEAFGLQTDPFEWCGRYACVPNPAPTRLARYMKVPGMQEKAREFFGGIMATWKASRARSNRRRPCGPR